jgi:hypothetical protein
LLDNCRDRGVETAGNHILLGHIEHPASKRV